MFAAECDPVMIVDRFEIFVIFILDSNHVEIYYSVRDRNLYNLCFLRDCFNLVNTFDR